MITTNEKTNTNNKPSVTKVTTSSPVQSTHSLPKSNTSQTSKSTEATRTPLSRTSNHSRSSRPTGNRITSENFLTHRVAKTSQTIADLKKLVKKDEIPVRIFSLGGLEEI